MASPARRLRTVWSSRLGGDGRGARRRRPLQLQPGCVRGDAVAALRAMGCYEELRTLSTGATDVDFVDRAGRRVGGFAIEPSSSSQQLDLSRRGPDQAKRHADRSRLARAV